MNSGDHDHGDHARHCHGHHHHHGTAGRTLGIALVLTLGFSVVEFVAGWRAGSLALLADSGRMVSDGAALGLSALAAWLAARPPSRRHTYGLGKAELLAALVNALSTPSAGSWRGWPASAKCTTCTSGRSAPSAWRFRPMSGSTAWPTGRAPWAG